MGGIAAPVQGDGCERLGADSMLVLLSAQLPVSTPRQLDAGKGQRVGVLTALLCQASCAQLHVPSCLRAAHAGRAGTGKTLIARQIGKMLNGKEPKIVNGPEVLNKYVGASEENIRNLFKVGGGEYPHLLEAGGAGYLQPSPGWVVGE